MYPISARFAAAIPAGYRVATSCQLLVNGTVADTLPLSGGSVSAARSDQARTSARSLQVVVTPGSPLLAGPQLTGDLTPFGAEVSIATGITYPDGSTELVPLGVLPVTDVTVHDSGADLTCTVDCIDRSWLVSIYKFQAPYAIAAGTNGVTALQQLITSVYPSARFNIAPTSATTPALTFNEGDDPWAAAVVVAAAFGYEVYFARDGVCWGQPIPDPLTTKTSWTYDDSSSGQIISLDRKLTRQGVSNDFTVTADSSQVQPPVRARSRDTDPNSVTYYGGPFGDVPTFLSSSIVTSTSQAQAAADNQLAAAKGGVEQLTLEVVPNPQHGIGDVIAVKRTRAGVDGLYVIDSITYPLGSGGTMQLTCRRVR